MKPTPPGWPRLSLGMYYDDPRAAIDFVCAAFGFERTMVVEGEGGRIEHSELHFGEALVMIGHSRGGSHRSGMPWMSPRHTGGQVTALPCLFVDAIDDHCERARAAGATITMEPTTSDYGEDYWADRSYICVDPEGQQWCFMQRMRGPGAA